MHIRDERRDPDTGVVGIADVLAMTAAVRSAVSEVVAAGERPFVLGGCCSLVPGAMAGARDVSGPLGIAHVDGHVDIYDGSSSPTGEAADMPVGVALGRAPAPWVAAAGGASTEAGKVIVLGAREEEEMADVASLLDGELADLRVLTPADAALGRACRRRRGERRAARRPGGALLAPPRRGRAGRGGHARHRLPAARTGSSGTSSASCSPRWAPRRRSPASASAVSTPRRIRLGSTPSAPALCSQTHSAESPSVRSRPSRPLPLKRRHEHHGTTSHRRGLRRCPDRGPRGGGRVLRHHAGAARARPTGRSATSPSSRPARSRST